MTSNMASPSGRATAATPSNPSVSSGAGIPDAVLFLDMDGVVLSGEELWRTRDHRYIPPAKIALVREVCQRTGCKVVVSSTWRHSDETRDLLLPHGVPLHRDWRTAINERMAGSIILGQRRGVEILGWLARHSVDAYAIVDDDDDMLPEQRANFVRTDFVRGIEQADADRLVSILAQGMSAEGQDPQGLGATPASPVACDATPIHPGAEQ